MNFTHKITPKMVEQLQLNTVETIPILGMEQLRLSQHLLLALSPRRHSSNKYTVSFQYWGAGENKV